MTIEFKMATRLSEKEPPQCPACPADHTNYEDGTCGAFMASDTRGAQSKSMARINKSDRWQGEADIARHVTGRHSTQYTGVQNAMDILLATS